MASSTRVGSRSSELRMRSYSASVSPSARWRSGEEAGGDTAGDRFEDPQSVLGPGERVDGVLGVGHQPEDVARLVAHAGDVVARPVGVLARGVAQQHLTLILQARELIVGGVVPARGVLGGDREPLT